MVDRNMPNQEDLDWVKLREDMDKLVVEPITDKALRKFKESPFVPIGCAATVAALTVGLYSFMHGRAVMSQYMMRARVVAQGATIIAVLVSLSANLPKQK